MSELKATRYYRSLLSADEQAVYDALLTQWMQLKASIRIEQAPCHLMPIFEAVMADYPLLFYVDFHAPSLHCYTPQVTTLESAYLYPKREAKALFDRCVNWGQAFVSNIPHGLCDADRALWLHDRLIEHVSYGNSADSRAYNILGVIIDRIAVCEGIAKCYKFLCDMADIPCIFVPGTMSGERHAWNMIWLNGRATFVDVTSDRSMDRKLSRSHFARNDAEMIGYTWDKTVIPPAVLRNYDFPIATADSPKELTALVRTLKPGGQIGIHLRYSDPQDPETMEKACRRVLLSSLNGPLLNMSFCPDEQILYLAMP